jgi:F-type H+-transporting ATPase subunit epsilon
MFTLNLVTPEKRVVAGQEIEELFVPGFRGELNILPGHAPLLTSLTPGVLKYRLKGESTLHYVAVSGGYAQVNPEGVNVMAETAERPEELNTARAQEVLKASEKRMLTEVLDEATSKEIQARAARAQARLDLMKLSGGASSSTVH